MGSAGAKTMAVVDGRADIYLHAGGQYEWDNCAPAAVALGAGLHASRIDGSPQIGRAHSELQSLMRISYAVFCLKKKKKQKHTNYTKQQQQPRRTTIITHNRTER